MSRSTSILVAGSLAVALLLAAVPVIGQQGWRLPGLDGGALTERDVASGATVLVVWAGWSPRCRDVVARTNRIASDFGGQARVATVNFQETPEEARAFLADKNLRVPVYMDRDGSFAKRHRVTTLPGLLVYRDGEVRYAGKLPDDPDATIRDALK